MLPQLSTWAEIEDYLEANQDRGGADRLPTSSTGPPACWAPTWLCPEIIAHEASKREGEHILDRSDLRHRHGLSTTWGSPARSRSRPSTFIAAIQDLDAVAGRVHGLERIYFLNGHGGNVSTMEAAFSEIYAGARFDRSTGRLRAQAAQLVGPAKAAMPSGQPPVPHRSRQPRHPVGDRGDPVGLSERDQGRQLRAPDRPYRPDPRSRRLPRPLSGRPHGLGPRPGHAGKGRHSWSHWRCRAWSPKWRSTQNPRPGAGGGGGGIKGRGTAPRRFRNPPTSAPSRADQAVSASATSRHRAPHRHPATAVALQPHARTRPGAGPRRPRWSGAP